MIAMDEFVFALPEIPNKTYPLASLGDYDRILSEAIQTWEENVRCGVILLYQVERNGRHNARSYKQHIHLGHITVDDARRKFQ